MRFNNSINNTCGRANSLQPARRLFFLRRQRRRLDSFFLAALKQRRHLECSCVKRVELVQPYTSVVLSSSVDDVGRPRRAKTPCGVVSSVGARRTLPRLRCLNSWLGCRCTRKSNSSDSDQCISTPRCGKATCRSTVTRSDLKRHHLILNPLPPLGPTALQ